MRGNYGLRRHWLPLIVSTMLLFACGWAALAQVDISAKLVGTVSDPSGAAVPNAGLAARNAQTGLVMRATSDERGNFVFASLPPGTYTLTCEAPGFKTYASSDVVLQAEKTVSLPVSLEVAHPRRVWKFRRRLRRWKQPALNWAT